MARKLDFFNEKIDSTSRKRDGATRRSAQMSPLPSRSVHFYLPFSLGATSRVEGAETTFEEQPACCCQGAVLVTTGDMSVRRVDFQDYDF